MFKKLFTAIALSLLLVGCETKSMVDQGRQKLEAEINRDSRGYIKLLKVEKTDGQHFEARGIKCYKMMFGSLIEFTDICTWSGSQVNDGWSNRFAAGPYSQPPEGLERLNPFALKGQRMVKGEKRTIRGEFIFEKTENGWHIRSW